MYVPPDLWRLIMSRGGYSLSPRSTSHRDPREEEDDEDEEEEEDDDH